MKKIKDTKLKIKDTKFWWILLVAIIMGLICHVVFGFSFWGIFLVVCLVWVAEKFAKILYLVAGVLLFVIAFGSYMPQTSSKIPFGIMKADLEVSKVIDTVQVKADEILEAEKNRQKEALLPQYNKLLREGKVAEARNLLDSIDNLFYPKEEVKAITQPIITDTVITVAPVIKDSVFAKGTYYIHVNGETPFNIVVVSRQECNKYQLDSTGGYKIAYDDGTVVADSPEMSQTFPFYERPRFRLKSNKPVTVTLVVT